jgi:septal ring factor EnvC (AmiA/AmiB activator)
MKLKIIFLPLLLSYNLVAVDTLHKALNSVTSTQQAAAKSQTTINQIDDERDELQQEYRSLLSQIETMKHYNRQLSDIVESQKAEMDSLNDQIITIDVTSAEILPLMGEMINALISFIELDLAFLPQERQARVQTLKTLLKRSDITVSEKYRKIIEAYNIESDYGHTIEAYRSTLKSADEARDVDFLRIGRIGLFYRTLDGAEVGFYNSDTQNFEVLAHKYERPLKKALSVAKKRKAPELFLLPLHAPQNSTKQEG